MPCRSNTPFSGCCSRNILWKYLGVCILLAAVSSSQEAIGSPEPCGPGISVPSMLCGNFQPAPSIAVCVGGTARTFGHHVVYRSLGENLINGFGGLETNLFAYLKLGDRRGDSTKGHGGHREWASFIMWTVARAVCYAHFRDKVIDVGKRWPQSISFR